MVSLAVLEEKKKRRKTNKQKKKEKRTCCEGNRHHKSQHIYINARDTEGDIEFSVNYTIFQ